ncbi:MAG TPA: carbamoyltransferase HypF, partial [Gallionella sp.]|nr:carbamoyltransferase HypF [Gallionella sp.]
MNSNSRHPSQTIAPEARRWLMGGRVQGVGYRAFVFNLAQRYGLNGVVQNLTGEVLVEAQGEPAALDAFAAALVSAAPPLARPQVVSCQSIPLRELVGFDILPSSSLADTSTNKSVRAELVEACPEIAAAGDSPFDKLRSNGLQSSSGRINNICIPPDSFLCDDCRREMLVPDDRRYRYPFINCTQCGPRYTLITRMPYDRPNTTMAEFPLCPACRAEYEDPHDRRFHAQPLACPVCGPQLGFVAAQQRVEGDAALTACIAALRRGETVAVKGIGGYHLICDALNPAAIARLRASKHRPHKPLALMFPWQGEDGLQRMRAELQLDAVTQDALCDASRPIVLIPRRADSTLPDSIAPGLNEIGAMLPYSPLHHLLLESFGSPLVATSGNVSGEPVLTDNAEAESRLSNVAQAFLHHNRPIARPADDSVLRVIAWQPRLLRAGRGVAPLEFGLPFSLPQPLLAVGGHMKNSIALAWNDRAVVSPHIGDLDSPRSLAVFEQVIAELCALYQVSPQRIVCDAHPGYTSSKWADRRGLPVQRVYHHHAHASALAGESYDVKNWLTFTWDGAGYGADGTLWGGEALLGKPGAWNRAATFRLFHLPGGERAGRECWRSAAALCWETGLDWSRTAVDSALVHQAWQRRINAPASSAAGRLFDAAASLLGLVQDSSFEGQGPMWLEAASSRTDEHVTLPLRQRDDGVLESDWQALLPMLRDEKISVAQRGGMFHATLAHA